MKSEIGKHCEEKKYPYLGVFETGDIILFTSPGTGLCVHGGRSHYIGFSSTIWNESEMLLFTGTVTLSN